jgi:hypothetical protein
MTRAFDLDLIGFDATDLEPILARADGELGAEPAEKSGTNAGRPLATGQPPAAMR